MDTFPFTIVSKTMNNIGKQPNQEVERPQQT